MKTITTIRFSKPIKRVYLAETFHTLNEKDTLNLAKRFYDDDSRIKIKVEVENTILFEGSYSALLEWSKR